MINLVQIFLLHVATGHLIKRDFKSHLIYKRVELGARLLGALLKLLLSFVHILLYSLPVHLDVAGVVSNLKRKNGLEAK